MKSKENRQPSLPEETSSYYEMGLEAERLLGAEGELEFARTKEIISRYLPNPPAVVLDVGGGPGAYACWLAQEGFEVHLTDPIPLHLQQASQASQRQSEFPVSSITLGDARKLEYPDGYADVVLLLGPLYHLTERSDRVMALQEAFRVLKQGGLLIAVGISRFASTFQGLIEGYFEDADFIQIAKRDLADGQHRNPTSKASYFTTSFFHHPNELEEEVQAAGFVVESVLAIEGAAVFLQDLDEQWSVPERRSRMLEAIRWLEDEPSIIGVTGHIVAIGNKSE
ncbi:MAG: class I SAM-dependent methyltransferase [Chloroflexota bacterium]|nr:class I SAM-dependent methyltransferase [Chloroflexota bacterium]